MSNVVDFKAEAEKRRDVVNAKRRAPPAGIENSSYHKYVLELEHELLEMQQQLCVVHRDLVRARARAKRK